MMNVLCPWYASTWCSRIGIPDSKTSVSVSVSVELMLTLMLIYSKAYQGELSSQDVKIPPMNYEYLWCSRAVVPWVLPCGGYVYALPFALGRTES
jgi:hypothetical protein